MERRMSSKTIRVICLPLLIAALVVMGVLSALVDRAGKNANAAAVTMPKAVVKMSFDDNFNITSEESDTLGSFNGAGGVGYIGASTSATSTKVAFDAGKEYKGVKFTKSDSALTDRVTIPNSFSKAKLNPKNDSFSVTMWINLAAYSSVQYESVIMSQYGGDAMIYVIGRGQGLTDIDKGKIGLMWNGSEVVTTSVLPLNSWHHLAVTVKNNGSDSTITAYLDGVDMGGSKTYTIFNSTGDFWLGQHKSNSGRGVDATIDEFCIYDDALTAEQVGQSFIGVPESENIITYELKGGTNNPLNPTSYEVEEGTLPLLDPTKEGHTFDGWALSGAPSAARVTEIDTSLGGEVFLYANWKINKYTVDFKVKSNAVDSQEEDYGTAIDFTTANAAAEAEVAAGYEFVGWFNDQNVKFEGTTIPGESITLYAKISAIVYTITYNLNGGTNAITNKETYTVEDIYVPFAFPDKAGHTSFGWFEASDLSGIAIMGIMGSEMRNVTLYAKWMANPHTITFDINGDTSNTQTAGFGTDIAFPDVTASIPAGQEFLGWFTSPAPGFFQKYTGTTIPDNELTLTAKFGIVYTITYHLNGGTNAAANPATYNEFDMIMLGAPTKAGYLYATWYTNAEFTGIPTMMVFGTGNIDLYAQWSLPIDYDITYVLDGGTNGSNPIKYNGDDSDITLADATKAGYTFAGWYASPSFAPMTKVETIYTASAEEITLYAKWLINNYSVTFSINGTTGQPVYGDYGTEIPFPTAGAIASAPEGKTFVGWYEDGIVKFTGTTFPSRDMVLVAKYADVYTITYELNGGTNNPLNPATFTSEDMMVLLEDPSREGYTFAGWFNNSGLTGVAIPPVIMGGMMAQNTTVYAKWEIVTYTITYNLSGGTNNVLNPASYTVETLVNEMPFIMLENPTRDGFVFGGWYETPDFSGTPFGMKIITSSARNITLYAKWGYSVTYNNTAGVTNTNALVYYESSADITLTALTRIGYDFGGWYATSDFSDEAVTKIAAGSTGAKTFYAKWTPKEYTISFGGVLIPAMETFNFGDEILFPATAKPGYEFDGWVFGMAVTGTDYCDSVTVDEAIVAQALEMLPLNMVWLTAKYTTIQYDITFDIRGDETSQKADYNSLINFPNEAAAAAAAAGYEFIGWVYSSDNTEFTLSIVPLNGFSIKAEYAPIEYSITYYGGANGANANTYTVATATITLADATKAGYTFDGWYDGEGAGATKVTQIALGSTGNKTLYAKFTLISYAITYSLDGGTNGANAANYTIETETITLADASKTGYTFIGWYDGEGAEAAKVTQIEVGSTGNITLYARYTLNSYAVSYNANGGSGTMSNSSFGYNVAKAIDANTFTREGYTFKGWNTAADGSGTAYADNAELTVTGNVTLYAVWEQNAQDEPKKGCGKTSSAALLLIVLPVVGLLKRKTL